MDYVLIANLTEDYIMSLVTRNGFTDVSADHADDLANWNCLYAIQDLDENVKLYANLQDTRIAMINAYVIQQNS